MPAAGPFRSGDPIIKAHAALQNGQAMARTGTGHQPPHRGLVRKKQVEIAAGQTQHLPVEERVNIVRAAFEGTGVHSPVQGGLKQRAGQRCLPAGAGRGRHHHSGERYGLMFHGSSSSQWVPRILIIAALQTKCNLRIQTFLPFPGPIQKAPRKKEGDPPRTCSGTPVSRRGRRSPHGIGWCGGAILQSTQGGILH